MREREASEFVDDADAAIGRWCQAAIEMGEVSDFMFVVMRNLAALSALSDDPNATIEWIHASMVKMVSSLADELHKFRVNANAR